MAEALAEVKRQFGRDAVILNTRSFTHGGLFGIGGKPCVEITAARQMADLPKPLRRGRLQHRPNSVDRAEGAATTLSQAREVAAPQSPDALLTEVGSLKALVAEVMRETRRSQAPHLPDTLFDTYQTLVQNNVAEQHAQQLVQRIRNDLTAEQQTRPEAVRAHLAGMLEKMLPTAGPIKVAATGRPTVIALIGPTGVGKTTTIAKLAANFCLRERLSVGLITIDTYRIAAVEQLKTYAKIIDVAIEVAASPTQLVDALGRMSNRDVILIDTAGRSQRDSTKMDELKTFLDVAKPDEVHLVLSSTAGDAVLAETIDRFRRFGVDRVIFTKLDEALGFGAILNSLQKAEARLSYVTTGQDVPDDIETGRGRALAEMILGNVPAPSAATAEVGRQIGPVRKNVWRE